LLAAGRRAYASDNIKNTAREETMRHPLLAAISVAFAITLPGMASAQAPPAALTGLVSSPDEATMEGVLVSATKAGSNITVTVVTGADGRFSFPANRLAPGQYNLAVRAVGYQLLRAYPAPTSRSLNCSIASAATGSNASCARNTTPTAS
jgi:hypothetical protein